MAWYRIVPLVDVDYSHGRYCSVCRTLIQYPERYKWLAHKQIEVSNDEAVILGLSGYEMEPSSE